MAVFTQDAYLPHHGLANMRVFIFTLFELFDGNDASGFPFLRLEDFTVGALANHLQYTVLIHL